MADEWWKKQLIDYGSNWDDYTYWEPEGGVGYSGTDWASSEGRTASQYYAPMQMDYSGEFDSSEWDVQQRSFLNQPDPGWEDFELGQGDYAGTWETEEERKALEDDYSWSDIARDWIGVGAEGAKILGQLGQGIKAFTGAQKAGGSGLTGVRSKYREPKIKGGGPVKLTAAQKAASSVARLNAAAGSRRGGRAGNLIKGANARVNRENNLSEIISAALGGRGASGQTKAPTIRESERLRRMQIRMTASSA